MHKFTKKTINFHNESFPLINSHTIQQKKSYGVIGLKNVQIGIIYSLILHTIKESTTIIPENQSRTCQLCSISDSEDVKKTWHDLLPSENGDIWKVSPQNLYIWYQKIKTHKYYGNMRKIVKSNLPLLVPVPFNTFSEGAYARSIVIYSFLLCSYFLTHFESFFVVFFLSIASFIGVAAGAHRLWAHRSYKAHGFLKFVLLILQTCSGTVSYITMKINLFT